MTDQNKSFSDQLSSFGNPKYNSFNNGSGNDGAGPDGFSPSQQFTTLFATINYRVQVLVTLKKRYFSSLLFLRLPLIFLLTAGWIVDIIIPKNKDVFNNLSNYVNETTNMALPESRIAYLVIGASATLASWIIYLVFTGNFIGWQRNSRLPWIPLITLIDVVFMSGMIAVSVINTIREVQISKSPNSEFHYNNTVKAGTFATSAGLGYGSSLLYFANIINQIVLASSVRSVKSKYRKEERILEQEDRNREIEEAYSNQYNRDPYDNSDNNNNYNNNNNDYTRSNNAPSNNNYGRGSAAYPNQPPYGPYPVNNFDMRPDSYNFYP